MQQLIFVGLGNQIETYAQTRHNLGAEVLHAWADKFNITKKTLNWRHDPRTSSLITNIVLPGQTIVCLLPQAGMNISGDAVKSYLSYHALSPAKLLVIHDDIELTIGEVQYQHSGSAHGHNGVRSIKNKLGTADFSRLRLGIGRPPVGVETSSFVLSAFTPEEQSLLAQFLASATKLLNKIAREGLPTIE